MNASDGPTTIYIIRHGEKLGNPASDDDGPDLSIRGSARAAALPSLFAPATPEYGCALTAIHPGYVGQYSQCQTTGPAPPLSMPDFLFAAAPSDQSNRPVETVTPLAAALELSLNTSYADDQYAGLADEITSTATYSGKIILICWHHGKIPRLAEHFGVTVPHKWKKWPATVFDCAWEIRYGHKTLHFLAQQLLYGDAKTYS